MSNQKHLTKRQILDSYLNREKEFIEEVVIPLFNKMGHKVLDNQGALELGKDLILIKSNDLLGDQVTAVVVKAKDISNTSLAKKDKETVADISRQVNQSWTNTITKENLKDILPNTVFVVTCGAFSNTAETELLQSVQPYNKSNTKFFGKDNLIPLIDAHYPELWVYEMPTLSVYLNGICKWIEKKTMYESGLEKEINSIGITCARKINDDAVKNKLAPEPASVIRDTKYVWLQGGSGSGKTFSIWHLSKALLSQLKKNRKKSAVKSQYIPVIINAKNLLSVSQIDKESLTLWLHSRASEVAQVPSIDDLESWFKNHGLTIVIDELELNRDGDNLNRLHELLVATNFNFSLVLLSRFFTADSLNLNFKPEVWYMRDINIAAATKIVKVAADHVGGNARSAYKEFVKDGLLNKIPRTPLALNAIRIIFSGESSQTPNNGYEFFDMLLGILLGKWEVGRETTKPFDYKQVRVFLEKAAYRMVSTNRIEIPVTELLDIAHQVLDAVAEKGISPEDYIERITEMGRVCSVENGMFFFLQRTYQEFLAGSHIFAHKWNHDELLSKFTNIFWEEAIIFAAGAKNEDNEFLEKLPSIPAQDHEELFQKMKNIGLVTQALYHSRNTSKARAIRAGAECAVLLRDDPGLARDFKKVFPNLSEVYLTYMTLKLFKVFYGKLTLLSSLETLVDKNISGRTGYYFVAALLAQAERVGLSKIEQAAKRLDVAPQMPEYQALGGFIKSEVKLVNSVSAKKILESKKVRKLAKKTYTIIASRNRAKNSPVGPPEKNKKRSPSV